MQYMGKAQLDPWIMCMDKNDYLENKYHEMTDYLFLSKNCPKWRLFKHYTKFKCNTNILTGS